MTPQAAREWAKVVPCVVANGAIAYYRVMLCDLKVMVNNTEAHAQEWVNEINKHISRIVETERREAVEEYKKGVKAK